MRPEAVCLDEMPYRSGFVEELNFFRIGSDIFEDPNERQLAVRLDPPKNLLIAHESFVDLLPLQALADLVSRHQLLCAAKVANARLLRLRLV